MLKMTAAKVVVLTLIGVIAACGCASRTKTAETKPAPVQADATRKSLEQAIDSNPMITPEQKAAEKAKLASVPQAQGGASAR